MTLAGALGLAMGAIALLAVVPGGSAAIGAASVGVVLLAAGRYRMDRAWVRLGGVLLFVAVLIAGVRRSPDALVLLATVAAVVAWDATDTAVALRRQLGRGVTTSRAELVHLGATVVAGGSVAAVAMLAASLARGRLPALAGVVLVGGAILLTLGLVPFARDAAP